MQNLFENITGKGDQEKQPVRYIVTRLNQEGNNKYGISPEKRKTEPDRICF